MTSTPPRRSTASRSARASTCPRRSDPYPSRNGSANLSTGSKWYGGETISVGIGQGAVGVTPLGLARFYALLATKGKLLTPHLFYGFRATRTTPWRSPRPASQGHTSGPQNLGDSDEGLREVVQSGTASANPFVREIAKEIPFSGKTGTAQVATFVDKAHYARQAKKLKDHALFAGYAPSEHRRSPSPWWWKTGLRFHLRRPRRGQAREYWCVDRLTNPLPRPGQDGGPLRPRATDGGAGMRERFRLWIRACSGCFWRSSPWGP